MPRVVKWRVKQFRIVAAVGIAASLLVFGFSRTSALQSSVAAPSSCTAASVADGVNNAGLAQVVSVSALGCEESWAYLWADITAGSETIGVTVVLKWRPDLNGWRPTDRVVTCVKGVLPEVIYTQGCFSN